MRLQISIRFMLITATIYIMQKQEIFIMAYLICSFEELLLYYGCNKDEWRLTLEKLWKYTNIKYLDDWMYEIAEYMPESILNDSMEDAEYITIDEFEYLYKIYNKCNQEIKCFIKKIYECGTCELYSRLCDFSPNTLEKIGEAINILKENNIDLVDIKLFERYTFNECNGWGTCFEGKQLSKFI